MGISIGTIGLAYCAVSLKTSEVSDRSEDQLVALAMVLNVLRCKAGRDPNRQCAVKSRTCCLSVGRNLNWSNLIRGVGVVWRLEVAKRRWWGVSPYVVTSFLLGNKKDRKLQSFFGTQGGNRTPTPEGSGF